MLDAKQLFRCMCAMSGMFPRLPSAKLIDAIFIWGRAADEWQHTRFDNGLLALVARLYTYLGAHIVLPGYVGSECGQGENGYPGPMVWCKELCRLHVDGPAIVILKGQGCNTKTEMDDFLDEAKRRGWKTVIAVTTQFHALRAMLGTVKSLMTRGMEDVIVVPVWSSRYDWTRPCYGSQGAGPHFRLDWIDQELERIPRYHAQGDLATLEELFLYLSGVYERISTPMN
jgi:hypothetical protein